MKIRLLRSCVPAEISWVNKESSSVHVSGTPKDSHGIIVNGIRFESFVGIIIYKFDKFETTNQ